MIRRGARTTFTGPGCIRAAVTAIAVRLAARRRRTVRWGLSGAGHTAPARETLATGASGEAVPTAPARDTLATGSTTHPLTCCTTPLAERLPSRVPGASGQALASGTAGDALASSTTAQSLAARRRARRCPCATLLEGLPTGSRGPCTPSSSGRSMTTPKTLAMCGGICVLTRIGLVRLALGPPFVGVSSAPLAVTHRACLASSQLAPPA